MKSTFKRFVCVMFSGLILFGLGATLLFGKMEYTKKEGKACTVCHVKTGSKDLNEVGKCYAKDHSLKDCKVPEKK